MTSDRRRAVALTTLFAAFAFFAPACGGEGDEPGEVDAKFQCGALECTKNAEYCLQVKGNDGSTNDECVANPCEGELSCDCVADDAENRDPACASSSCRRTKFGSSIQLTKTCGN